jgi:hypothetical protein
LTLGQLRRAWAGLPDQTPILLGHHDNPHVADWVQHADTIIDETRQITARLFAPPAKQGYPPPGTVWNPATVITSPGPQPGR